tara:strand:+ start:59 stop:508 length:450 start_codon:yes stop_codon:yes gene_type:complete
MKLLIALFFVLGSFSSFSKVHEVKLLNKGTDGQKMVFEPMVLFIKKGDSVKFIPTDKSHNVMSMTKKGGVPTGSKKWKGKTSKVHIQKFDEEGIHGIKCRPHLAMGMVGAVVVGKAKNYDAFKKVRLIGKAKKRFKDILKTVKTGKAGK